MTTSRHFNLKYFAVELSFSLCCALHIHAQTEDVHEEDSDLTFDDQHLEDTVAFDHDEPASRTSYKQSTEIPGSVDPRSCETYREEVFGPRAKYELLPVGVDTLDAKEVFDGMPVLNESLLTAQTREEIGWPLDRRRAEKSVDERVWREPRHDLLAAVAGLDGPGDAGRALSQGKNGSSSTSSEDLRRRWRSWHFQADQTRSTSREEREQHAEMAEITSSSVVKNKNGTPPTILYQEDAVEAAQDAVAARVLLERGRAFNLLTPGNNCTWGEGSFKHPLPNTASTSTSAPCRDGYVFIVHQVATEDEMAELKEIGRKRGIPEPQFDRSVAAWPHDMWRVEGVRKMQQHKVFQRLLLLAQLIDKVYYGVLPERRRRSLSSERVKKEDQKLKPDRHPTPPPPPSERKLPSKIWDYYLELEYVVYNSSGSVLYPEFERERYNVERQRQERKKRKKQQEQLKRVSRVIEALEKLENRDVRRQRYSEKLKKLRQTLLVQENRKDAEDKDKDAQKDENAKQQERRPEMNKHYPVFASHVDTEIDMTYIMALSEGDGVDYEGGLSTFGSGVNVKPDLMLFEGRSDEELGRKPDSKMNLYQRRMHNKRLLREGQIQRPEDARVIPWDDTSNALPRVFNLPKGSVIFYRGEKMWHGMTPVYSGAREVVVSELTAYTYFGGAWGGYKKHLEEHAKCVNRLNYQGKIASAGGFSQSSAYPTYTRTRPPKTRTTFAEAIAKTDGLAQEARRKGIKRSINNMKRPGANISGYSINSNDTSFSCSEKYGPDAFSQPPRALRMRIVNRAAIPFELRFESESSGEGEFSSALLAVVSAASTGTATAAAGANNYEEPPEPGVAGVDAFAGVVFWLQVVPVVGAGGKPDGDGEALELASMSRRMNQHDELSEEEDDYRDAALEILLQEAVEEGEHHEDESDDGAEDECGCQSCCATVEWNEPANYPIDPSP